MGHCLRLLFLSCHGPCCGLVVLNHRLRLGGRLVVLNHRLRLGGRLMMHYRLGPRCLVMMHYYMLRCRFVMNNHRLVCYYYRLIS